MGTGIVANAAVTLPRSCPGLRTFAVVVWVGAALLLILLAVAYLRQRALRVHAADPVAAQFFGAPPVALCRHVVAPSFNRLRDRAPRRHTGKCRED